MNIKIEYNRDRELSNCGFVKTVLMLMVVIYHCIVFWTGNWFVNNPVFSSKLLSTFSGWMNSFHVYGFTLTSGYLFFFLKHEKARYSRFLPFIFNKIKRLLIPYVFVSLIWVIPSAVYFFKYDTIEIIQKFVLGISPSQLWFLLMLFSAFLIFYPLSNFFRSNDIYGAIVVVLIYGFGLIGLSVFPNVFQIFSACTYIPLFWIGFKMRQYGSLHLRKVPILLWVLIDVILFILVQLLCGLNGIVFTLLKLGFDFVLHIFGGLMSFIVLQKIADRIKWHSGKIGGLLTRSSMTIYLFHQQVIYFLIYWLNGVVNPYVHVVVNFTGAMLISLAISFVMMKFKWTRFLIGEK